MPTKLQAWRAHRQGLDGSLSSGTTTAAQVVQSAGWVRSVGGANPYLALHSRAEISREAADAALKACEIQELPAVRNCTYLLPAADFALGLRAGQAFWENGEMRPALNLGVTEKEVNKLCDAVLAALAGQPLDPEAIRAAVGPAARSLGDEGKKKGVASTLPLALGKLQAYGQIRRIPANGRLDQQRYRYATWSVPELKMDGEEVALELALRYFKWIGPASAAEFQGFSGLGAKAAKAAMAAIGLVEFDDGGWMLQADRQALEAFTVPLDARYALVGSLDSISLLRRDLQGLLASHHGGYFDGLAELPNHAILDRGSLAGLWDFDTDRNELVWISFVGKNRELESAVAKTEAFVRDELGDARSFSLDSPKSRMERIAKLRKFGT